MRKSKFSETQIVGILKEAEAGVAVNDLLRTHGISRATFFKWRSKYGGASVSDVTRLRELETENAKLKRMYAAWHSRTRPSRMSWPENYRAVREATGGRPAGR